MLKLIEGIYLGKAEPESGGGGSLPVIDELNVTPSTSAQTITAPSGTDGYSPVNVAAVTATIDTNITSANIVDGVTILGVTGNAVELNGETINITPSTSQQIITPTSPANGITQATVAAVTAAIDNNIVASNIVSGVTILGVAGSATTLNGTTLSVTPSTSAQTLTPTSPNNGFTEVSVSAVTSSIDANITAGNIKKDVVILGVTGSYEGTSPSGRYSIRANGIYNIAQYSSVDVQVDASILGVSASGFVNVSGSMIISGYTWYDVNGSSITYVGNSALKYRFAGMNIKSADFGNVANALENSFEGCFAGINAGTYTGVFDFSSIQNPNLGSFRRLFYDAKLNTNTEIKFTNLTDLSDNLAAYCFYEAFARDNNNSESSNTFPTSITFQSLQKVNVPKSFYRAFAYRNGLQSISFPSLQSNGVDNYNNIFTDMLVGVTGCTVHFPAALQSTMQNYQDVTSGFGGTNTTVLFDLIATE